MSGISQVIKDVETLQEQLGINHIYVPWIHIVIKDSNKLTKLDISTRDSSNLYASIQYDKNGSQSANSLTIVLCYKPYDLLENDPDKEKLYDINYIENILIQTSSECKNSDLFPTIEFEYGYQYPDSLNGIKSSKYKCSLTDFTTEIQDGFVIITITAYSNIITTKNFKISTTGFGYNSENNGITISDEDNLNPLRLMMSELINNFSLTVFDKEDGYEVINNSTEYQENVNKRLDFTMNNVSGISRITDITNSTYNDLNYNKNKSEIKAKRLLIVCNPGYAIINESLMPLETSIKGETNISFLGYISDMIGSMTSKVDYDYYNGFKYYSETTDEQGNVEKVENTIENTNELKKYVYYSYTVIDNIEDYSKANNFNISADDYDIAIEISMIRSDDYKDKTKNKIMLKFNWLNTKNSIVNTFRPSYKGINFITVFQSNINTREVIDETGNTSSTTGLNIEPTSSHYDSMRKTNELIDKISYPYEAQLQTIGIPADIPINSLFEVIPIVNGIKHISAGTYRLLSSSDTIDSSGFSSNFKLYRCELPDTYDENSEIYKTNSSNVRDNLAYLDMMSKIDKSKYYSEHDATVDLDSYNKYIYAKSNITTYQQFLSDRIRDDANKYYEYNMNKGLSVYEMDTYKQQYYDYLYKEQKNKISSKYIQDVFEKETSKYITYDPVTNRYKIAFDK